jgi:peptidoglycan/LPS O-acetylase OafA/YrhL
LISLPRLPGITSQKNSIAVLDGVRALACFSVISYHIHYFLAHTYNLSENLGTFGALITMAGYSGVTLFFVLSGFLLFMPYVKALLGDNPWPSARTFYLRRALRILPGYYVSLCLLILLIHPEYLQADHLKDTGLFLTLLMDSTLTTYQQINGPFWTLAVEWQFYMLLPLLSLGFSYLVRRGKSPKQRLWLLVICLLGMMIWGVGTRYVGRYYTLNPNETLLVPRPVLDGILLFTYGMAGKFFEVFAIGMLVSSCYVFSQQMGPEHRVNMNIRRYSLWLWSIGVIWLFFMAVRAAFPALSFLEPYLGPHNWLSEFGYAFGFGLCITAILFGPVGLQRLFELHLLRWIGTLSYSLYIWHLPILLFFRDWVISRVQNWDFSYVYTFYWLCVLCLIFPFAYVFYRRIEYPWIQLAHKTRPKEHAPEGQTTR